MDIHLRPARPQDYEALLPLFDEIDALHREHYPDRFQEPSGPAREREFFLTALNEEAAGFFVAETQAEIVGHVHVRMRETRLFPIVRSRRHAYINEIVVKAAYRSLGVGHLLMEHAEDWARAQGAATVELGVYEFNQSAQDFYRDLGYTTFYRQMHKDLKEN